MLLAFLQLLNIAPRYSAPVKSVPFKSASVKSALLISAFLNEVLVRLAPTNEAFCKFTQSKIELLKSCLSRFADSSEKNLENFTHVMDFSLSCLSVRKGKPRDLTRIFHEYSNFAQINDCLCIQGPFSLKTFFVRKVSP